MIPSESERHGELTTEINIWIELTKEEICSVDVYLSTFRMSGLAINRFSRYSISRGIIRLCTA